MFTALFVFALVAVAFAARVQLDAIGTRRALMVERTYKRDGATVATQWLAALPLPTVRPASTLNAAAIPTPAVYLDARGYWRCRTTGRFARTPAWVKAEKYRGELPTPFAA